MEEYSLLIWCYDLVADTSEVEFYLSNSEAFRKLSLPVREEFTKKGGICSPDGPSEGKHYLYVNPSLVEHVGFYVHEFTELIIFGIVEIENRNILKNKYTSEQLQKLSHKLSKFLYGTNLCARADGSILYNLQLLDI